ncbi:ribonuclease T2 family protein [Colletotrichum scovillei]|uniref:Ribonuclease T2 family protein n=1 Tax=Colletotrichum scovillei TaxID=1209932 RepID=A0A9P7UHC2_9PEZI|nr:ribonuclease T2 family protein [Colletotrichum scovillei]KAF4785927.1 ribonuclease T2 family protein [Colletotrichum scovillei]KAG7055796.1 ribonuclease T2 family protein [Colletotrichum scovillei]KAG7075237.1 ribonuclease T2 family protein [Colletotrichum scovillei]KAG7082234.1 ribonuclease T2 family protein [Colletotrichum scovillei]
MAPSLRALLQNLSSLLPHLSPITNDITSTSSSLAAPPTTYEPLSGAPQCPIDGSARNACCHVYPSSRLLLTQYWDDTVHAPGAEEDWTLHGLWPEPCDGSYKAFYGTELQFTNITDILKHYGQDELLALMERYWVAAYGANNNLWANEYNTHASCINTLSSTCYDTAYDTGIQVVDYFTRAFSLFRQLDTFTALERAGITPSISRRYALAEVTRTLERLSGGRVVLRCSGQGRDVLHEAWYSYSLMGSLQTGQFVPASDLGSYGEASNCAKEVRYLPKTCKGNCPNAEL